MNELDEYLEYCRERDAHENAREEQEKLEAQHEEQQAGSAKKDVSLWQWTAFNNGWVQDGRGYRAAGVWCGVWDLHGREWQAEVVAKRIAGYHLRWKWQCRPIDDACLPDRDGDQIQIVMLRDSATIDCSGTRWNTSFPIAPSEALINCQAILMAMGFANSRPRNPIPLVSPRELLEMQGLRP